MNTKLFSYYSYIMKQDPIKYIKILDIKKN